MLRRVMVPTLVSVPVVAFPSMGYRLFALRRDSIADYDIHLVESQVCDRGSLDYEPPSLEHLYPVIASYNANRTYNGTDLCFVSELSRCNLSKETYKSSHRNQR